MIYDKKRTFCIYSLFVALLMATACDESLSEKQAEKGNSKEKPPFTISKETTVITEPLRPDGYPDYVEAFNRRFREGVTPENNSAVLFWQAVGPGEIEKDHREKYFQMLGIPPLPEKGNYLTEYETSMAAEVDRLMKKEQSEDESRKEELKQRLQDEFQSAIERPWSREELPWLAAWLDANENPLAMLVEASNRPRRYDLLIGPNVIFILLPGPQKSRDVARALLVRAMLRLKEGKVDEARQDIMACHKLARLVGQGPTCIELLISMTIDIMALTGDRALAQYGNLTSVQIEAIHADVAQLPPMPRLADKIDEGERFLFLDMAFVLERDKLNGFAGLMSAGSPDGDKGGFGKTIESAGDAVINWDTILRMGNSWYDRLVVGMKKPTSVERQETYEEIIKELSKIAESTRNNPTPPLSMLGKPDKAISERVGHVLLELFLPSCLTISKLEDRSMIQFELTDLAFALAAYKADNGMYPTRLEELVPKYTKAIRTQAAIRDIDLRYSRENDGYLLYSFAVNGVDDGGKGRKERNELDGEDRDAVDWDDIVVRVPSRE